MRRHRAAPLFVFLGLVLSCSQPPATPAPPTLARVLELDGEVTQDGRPLKVGDQISLATLIEVKTGRAVLELPGRGQLRLLPRTRARLIERDRLQLLVGKVWALIEAVAGGGYAVETDNAVAGVRGTEFVVEAEAERTAVAVLSGAVEVTNKRRAAPPVTVRESQRTVVTAAEPPAPPVAYDPAPERQAWEQPALEPERPVPTPREPTAPELAPSPGKRPPTKVLSPQEQQGERTKQELKREGEQTRQELRREEDKTRTALEQQEAATKKALEEEARQIKEGREPKSKGSVKDFLE